MLLVVSCLNILYINTIHVGVHYCNYNAVICSYLRVLFWLWSSVILPFDFLMEQLHCWELIVAMFYTVHFYVSWGWFALFYGFIHFSGFCVWLSCVSDCNWRLYYATQQLHACDSNTWRNNSKLKNKQPYSRQADVSTLNPLLGVLK
jgi:hypothetical protein